MEVLAHWKGILASIAGILVVALQIIQLLISGQIETRVENNSARIEDNTHRIDQKAETLQEKSDTLNTVLAAHGQITRENRALLVELHNELHALEEATKPKAKK